jgi:C-terminal processing protease CtpA/Prc
MHWEIRDGDVLLAGQRAGTSPVRLTRPAPPIAVLTSQHTSSSGEATLVSFLGMDRVRTFGLPTAGYSTANTTVELSDGALLVLTVAVMADRTGRRYGTSIVPDVLVSPRDGADVTAATAWRPTAPSAPGGHTSRLDRLVGFLPPRPVRGSPDRVVFRPPATPLATAPGVKRR